MSKALDEKAAEALRQLGHTEDEIAENEKLWHEERSKAEPPAATGQDLRGVGISPSGMETDITTGEELADFTAAAPPPETSASSPAPGQQPAAAVVPQPVTPPPA